MTTAFDLITRALTGVSRLGEGQTPQGPDAQACLIRLNDLIDAWATDSLYAWTIAEHTYTLTGGTVTIGPTGNIVAPIPSRIEDGYVRSGDYDYGFRVVDYPTYAGIAYKSAAGSPWPSIAYYDGNGTINFYPVPSGGVLHLPVLSRLTEFATLTTDYALPPGYRKAIALSLEEEIAPDFGAQISPLRMRQAATARRAIKRTNHRVPLLVVPTPGGSCGSVILGGGDGAGVYQGGNAGSI